MTSPTGPILEPPHAGEDIDGGDPWLDVLIIVLLVASVLLIIRIAGDLA